MPRRVLALVLLIVLALSGIALATANSDKEEDVVEPMYLDCLQGTECVTEGYTECCWEVLYCCNELDCWEETGEFLGCHGLWEP